MAKIADFSSIVVETDVPEGRLHLVGKGAPVRDRARRVPRQALARRGRRDQPQLNRAKATATVKVRFLDRDDTVLPEMAARVSFLDAPLDATKLKEPPKTHRARARRWPSAAGAKVVFVVGAGQGAHDPGHAGRAVRRRLRAGRRARAGHQARQPAAGDARRTVKRSRRGARRWRSGSEASPIVKLRGVAKTYARGGEDSARAREPRSRRARGRRSRR